MSDIPHFVDIFLIFIQINIITDIGLSMQFS